MQTINRQDLEKMNGSLDRDFVLINVLSPSDFKQQHIRTSINIPLEAPDFADTVARVAGHKERDIVVYCADFDCDASPQAARKLERAGFTHVFDYEGGSRDWLENH